MRIRRPAVARATLPLLLAVASAACSEVSADVAHTVRDSAGVRVVESAAPAWREGEGWTVAAEPLLSIGDVEGEAPYQFDRVAGVLRLSDGRIVVANGGSQELRWFSADGRFLRAAGGEGGGPGEFRSLQWIGVGRADSLLAWDTRERRLSVFHAEGGFARAVTPDGLKMFPRAAGALADGSVLLLPGFDISGEADEREGENRDTATFLRLSADGVVLGDTVRVAGPESFRMRNDRGTMNDHVIFGRRGVLVVAGDRVYVGDTDRFELVGLTPGGSPDRAFRRRHESAEVTSADVERFHADREAEEDAAASRPEIGAFLESMRAAKRRIPHRATLPAFAQARADTEGNLWMERARRPGDDAPQWDVFDPDGRWLGTVGTPAGLEVRQIGADWVLGVAKDEMDVEHVRLHRIVKPSTS